MGLTIPEGDAVAKKNNTKTAKNNASVAAKEVTPEQAAVQAEAEVTGTGTETLYGADADKLIFLAPLGDPSRIDKTTITPKNGGQPKEYQTSTIVGYQFKATIDLDVPDIELGDDARENSMSFKGDASKTRHVKAGEVFNLTRVETGALISQDRFNGLCTGGDKPMKCVYNSKVKKASDGTVATVNSASKLPVIALVASTPGQSIKDYKMVDVLDFREVMVGGQKQKERTIKEGFEKFAPLCVNKTRRASAAGKAAGAGATASKANERNAGAAEFLKIMGMKRAPQA